MKRTIITLVAGTFIAGFVMFHGCGGGGGGGPGVKVGVITPSNGETNVPGGTNILVGFAKEDGSPADKTIEVEFSLTDPAGNSIPGDLVTTDPADPSKPFYVEVKEGSKTVKYPGFKFDPYGPELPFSNSERLAPETTYTVTVKYNGAREEFSFTTSSFGKPLTVSENSLKDRTYILDLAKATVEEPPKLFDFVQQLVPNFVLPPLLLNVHDINNPAGKVRFAGALACIGGTGDSSWCSANSKPFGAQDEGSPAIAFPLADFTAPFFTFGPQDFGLIIAGEKLQILQLVVGGIFAPDGNLLGEGVLQGIIDVKGVAAALGDPAYADLACQILPGVTGRSCKACPAPLNYSYCIDLKLTNIPNQLSSSAFKNIIAPVVTVTLSAPNADVTIEFKDLDENPLPGVSIDITLSGTGASFVGVPAGCTGSGLTRTCNTDSAGKITGIQITGTAGEKITVTATPTGTPPTGYSFTNGEAAITF